MSDLLSGAVTELYGRDPGQFTRRRQDLAARARAAGEPDAARKIAGLRRPTRSAWLVNKLVRDDPAVPRRLAELSAQLTAELAGSASGAARLRELTAARGRLVDELTRQALAVQHAGPAAASAALREEVAGTLDAAIADPAVAANLGRLVRAARWAGFGMAPAAGPGRARPDRSARPETSGPGPAAERARRHREKVDSAERALALASRDAEAAAEAERDLADAVRRLEAELAGARQQLAQARRRAQAAQSRRRRAAGELARIRE